MRYFYNDLHEIAVRFDDTADDNVVYVKTKGGQEVKESRAPGEPSSKAVTDAFIEKNDISKEEYDAF